MSFELHFNLHLSLSKRMKLENVITLSYLYKNESGSSNYKRVIIHNYTVYPIPLALLYVLHGVLHVSAILICNHCVNTLVSWCASNLIGGSKEKLC